MRRREVLKAGLAGLGSLAGGCFGAPATSYRWNNSIRTDGVSPARLESAAYLEQLRDAVREAEANGKTVRMTGSGHSFSDVAIGKDVLLVPGQLRRFLELDRSQLRAPHASDPTLVRVQAGARIREINGWLWRRGLSLGILGGWDEQTIVGAATTGTHGSSLAYGPIADALQSYQIVVTGGEVLQVERIGGITDPAKFPGFVETPAGGRVPARLVQDDDMFHAVAVSLGCLGLIYAVVVKAEPRFWLREVRTLVPWGDLTGAGGFLQRLLTGRKLDEGADPDPIYYEIYLNPYPPRQGGSKASHQCILTRRYKLFDDPSHLVHNERAHPPVGDALDKAAARRVKLLADQGDFELDARTRGPFGEKAEKDLTTLTHKGIGLRELVNMDPALAPDLVQIELAGVVDRVFIDRSYNVFNLGPVNEMRAAGIELAFDLKDAIRVGEFVFETAADLKRQKIMHAIPPSLRFVKHTDAFLAMQQGRDTVTLEMGAFVGQHGAQRLFETYEHRAMKDLRARPHWGLDTKVLQSFDQVNALFPSTASRWLGVYKQMNARGAFNGPLTERLHISMPGLVQPG